MMSGKLVKFKIEAFTSEKYEGKPVATFEVMFNPTNYSQKYEVEYEKAQGKGSSGSPQVYGKIKPQEYTFEFTIDGTGVTGVKKDVSTEVDNFFKIAGKHDGEIHRPKYLKLVWGTLVSKCVLKSANVTFNLFKPDGKPLRAKINATFSENIEDTLRAAEEKNSSPDLTHYRAIKHGDKLPLFAYRVYKDKNYYFQLAKVNKLNNFRTLKEGSVLSLPPVRIADE